MLRSPPSRRRGLKSAHSLSPITNIVVASFAEAWIEISLSDLFALWEWSPPSRRRGLKSLYLYCLRLAAHSRLLRGGVDWNLYWITGYLRDMCRLLRGGVDWNMEHIKQWQQYQSRLLRGGVDWNLYFLWYLSCILVASFAEAWIEINILWHENMER